MPLRELVSTHGNRAIPLGEREYRLEKPLYRTLTLDRALVDAEARTCPLTFSSEEPVERWFGKEVLDHSPGSCRLGRMNGGAALLSDHDWNRQVGVVENCALGNDRRGHAVVRFGRNERAEEEFRDVQDGIRRHTSVGYLIHRMVLETRDDEEGDTYRIVDWEPYEVSLVAVPADVTVGVGRSAAPGEPQEPERLIPPLATQEEKTMDHPTVTVPVSAAPAAPEASGQRDVLEILGAAAQLRSRIPDADDLARQHIEAGRSAAAFNGVLLERLRNHQAPVAAVPSPEIGMSASDARKFSVLRALNAALSGDWSKAGFEKEASDAALLKEKRQLRGSGNGFTIPYDVQKRDLVAGTTTAGGFTVQTDVLGGSFIDVLRNRMVCADAGATFLTGLQGNVSIPALSAGATAYWVAENAAPTESTQTLGQVALTPKTVGTYTDISRRLLAQSSIDVEGMVRGDLAKCLATALDLAALHGSGQNDQPTGIAGTNGIGSVAGGTNGLAPAWSHIVKLETEVAQDNADVNRLAYVTNAKVRGKLKQIFTNATYGEIPLWTGDGMLNGYRALCTNQVSSTLTKGSATSICSAIFFGNWADLIIGTWGGVDILVDPYTGSAAGIVRVRALQDADVAVRHAQSFAAMLDALTA